MRESGGIRRGGESREGEEEGVEEGEEKWFFFFKSGIFLCMALPHFLLGV